METINYYLYQLYNALYAVLLLHIECTHKKLQTAPDQSVSPTGISLELEVQLHAACRRVQVLHVDDGRHAM